MTAYALFIVVLFIPVLISIPGIVWAPFAALISALIARSRGLNAGRYALAGAIHSAAFLLPWIRLVLRMYSIPVPRGIAALVYILLYSLWLLSPILPNVTLSFIYYDANSWRPESVSHDEIVVMYVIAFVSAAAAAIYFYMWISSLLGLIRAQSSLEQPSCDSMIRLPIGDEYTRPFIFAFISVWTGLIVFEITNWMDTGCFIPCQ